MLSEIILKRLFAIKQIKKFSQIYRASFYATLFWCEIHSSESVTYLGFTTASRVNTQLSKPAKYKQWNTPHCLKLRVTFWSEGQTKSDGKSQSRTEEIPVSISFLSKKKKETKKRLRVAPLRYNWRKRWSCYLNAKARALFQDAKELKCRPSYPRTWEISPALQGYCI